MIYHMIIKLTCNPGGPISPTRPSGPGIPYINEFHMNQQTLHQDNSIALTGDPGRPGGPGIPG